MASITVDILTGDPSIKINKVDTIPVYIRKENMVSVVTASNKNLQSVNPNAPRDEEYIVYINLADGSHEKFDIQDVSNQAGWTINDAGLDQAASDIAQSV